MSVILTSDWQLSPNPRDAYRLDFLPWLVKLAKKHDEVWILGDLTEEKDGHSGWLVNLIVDQIKEITKTSRVLMLPGNHDGTNPANPFFRFLKNMELGFLSKPTKIEGKPIGFLPFEKSPWSAEAAKVMSDCQLILAHQEFKGARLAPHKVSEVKTGVPDHHFLLFSGHIHTPHDFTLGQGKVVYVGSPYPVDFGDDFQGGVIVLDLNPRRPELSTYKRLTYEAPKRAVVKIGKELSLKVALNDLLKGDQVRFKVTLPPEALNSRWPKFRKALLEECDRLGIIVAGIEATLENITEDKATKDKLEKMGVGTPEEIFNKYCLSEGVAKGSLIHSTGLKVIGANK